MCSVFEMENFQGDLTDVVRGTKGHVASPETSPPTIWSLPPPSNLDHITNPFGDPFVTMTDPLLQGLNAVTNSSTYFSSSAVAGETNGGDGGGGFLAPKVMEEDHIKSQCNIFPRIRISHGNIIHEHGSPCNSPAMSARHSVVAAAAAAASPRGVINVDTNSPRHCNTFSSQIQISSPRNLGLKRRKSQAKKVVCIPAPAAMNSRSSGEVVPSDLWAWRKYGQKPIKGSPFPRGYYRCSSSKGCSARKQVERSRTDPNMLVITYTSEHNHPWPIQRNALAGSTRSSSSSSSSTSSSSFSNLKSSTANATAPSNIIVSQNNINLPSTTVATSPSSSTVKYEQREGDIELQNVEEEEDDQDHHDIAPYRPEQHHEDFFADLDELEGDSLSMLLSHGDGRNVITAACDEGTGDFFGWSHVDQESKT
ncbi:unnamed protein product [Cochlearia groenlandica]